MLPPSGAPSSSRAEGGGVSARSGSKRREAPVSSAGRAGKQRVGASEGARRGAGGGGGGAGGVLSAMDRRVLEGGSQGSLRYITCPGCSCQLPRLPPSVLEEHLESKCPSRLRGAVDATAAEDDEDGGGDGEYAASGAYGGGSAEAWAAAGDDGASARG
eukprot:6209176-Prymnesium_polylepis.1